MKTDTLCMGCMADKGTAVVCPQCKYQEEENRSPLVLPYRTILNDKFLIGKVLGKPGGFGITYLAWDMILQTVAAIKEYLPRECASRDTDRTTVVPFSHEDTHTFSYGLSQFLQEAQTLITFNHSNVVRIREFFRANNTAYLVMDYYKGISLEEYLYRKGGKIPENVALKIMLPILSGLNEVHRKGFLHRDIKPSNIYLTYDNNIMLLDFGTARVAMGEHSKSLSVVLTPGFAPYEQYHSRGKQGPWTDIYACGATLYYLLTGIKPLDAIARFQHDDLVPPERLVPGISDRMNQAIMAALALNPEDRPQSVQEFHRLLVSKDTGTPAPAPDDDKTIPQAQTLPQPQTPPPVRPSLQLRAQTRTPSPATVTKYCPHCGIENVVPTGTPLTEVMCLSCRKPFAERRTRSKKALPAWLWGVMSFFVGTIVVIGVLVASGVFNKPPDVPVPETRESQAIPVPQHKTEKPVVLPTATPEQPARLTPQPPPTPVAEQPLAPPPDAEQPLTPPDEAINVCQGKKQGDPCTFSSHRQEILSGTCEIVRSGEFACRPARMPSQDRPIQSRPPQDGPQPPPRKD